MGLLKKSAKDVIVLVKQTTHHMKTAYIFGSNAINKDFRIAQPL